MTGIAAARPASPDDRCFATKPELARQMINRALEAGMPFGRVAADEVYGQNGPLRDWLEERHVSYVLAVPKSFPVATAAGLVRADHLAALVPAAGWQQVSCGDGSKGPRYYEERDRPGPLPGPPLPRLVPARHTVHDRACLPSGLRSSKGAPAAVDNFPGHACGMITMAATT